MNNKDREFETRNDKMETEGGRINESEGKRGNDIENENQSSESSEDSNSVDDLSSEEQDIESKAWKGKKVKKAERKIETKAMVDANYWKFGSEIEIG